MKAHIIICCEKSRRDSTNNASKHYLKYKLFIVRNIFINSTISLDSLNEIETDLKAVEEDIENHVHLYSLCCYKEGSCIWTTYNYQFYITSSPRARPIIVFYFSLVFISYLLHISTTLIYHDIFLQFVTSSLLELPCLAMGRIYSFLLIM